MPVTVESVAKAVVLRVMRLGSFLISLSALYVFTWADFRTDTIVMVLFCGMPLLSFPASLVFYRRIKAAAIAHWALALVYLVVYSMLDWRTCSAFGYCQSVMQTVLVTMTAWRVQGMYLIAAAATILVWLDARSAKQNEHGAAQVRA
ncbi:MAG: hypothetical protein KGN79_16845 [Acidobacteriota bacterium]|nr:hypothetical protein [Acidobacteriota bacterium]